ncbi:uncharacterized protein zgc:113276 isoform X5 [Labrus bergylta]|uniref:uncharacterized protein zgc:113276 isoform X5 n=1 Tax=Labrus bergylta TaxID=56723 RepID=UPI00331378CB
MVILDVLIIGAGPHALTLASLLLNPESGPNSDPGPDLPSCCSDPLRPQTNPQMSNNKRCNGKKRRRNTTVCAGLTLEEQLAKTTISENAVCPPLSVRVVDSYGVWTNLWESQFTALNIPHLRSHTLVHTEPLNKKALQEYVLKSARSSELHSLPDQLYILDENAFFNDMRLGKKEKKRLNITSTLKKSLSFSLPGTKLSVDFFKDQVERYNLDKVLVKGTVEHITPVTEEKTDKEEETNWIKEQETEEEAMTGTERKGDRTRKRVEYFLVQLQEGVVLKARKVVMATGPTRAQMANVPSWVTNIGESYPEERLQHTVHLMHHLATSQQKQKDADCQRPEEAFPPQAGEPTQPKPQLKPQLRPQPRPLQPCVPVPAERCLPPVPAERHLPPVPAERCLPPVPAEPRLFPVSAELHLTPLSPWEALPTPITPVFSSEALLTPAPSSEDLLSLSISVTPELSSEVLLTPPTAVSSWEARPLTGPLSSGRHPGCPPNLLSVFGWPSGCPPELSGLCAQPPGLTCALSSILLFMEQSFTESTSLC